MNGSDVCCIHFRPNASPRRTTSAPQPSQPEPATPRLQCCVPGRNQLHTISSRNNSPLSGISAAPFPTRSGSVPPSAFQPPSALSDCGPLRAGLRHHRPRSLRHSHSSARHWPGHFRPSCHRGRLHKGYRISGPYGYNTNAINSIIHSLSVMGLKVTPEEAKVLMDLSP
ncbi:hypothetical protein XENORESO_016791 [Xenotaenia resolanae]|uniref:Uncharacterized protein n=1 Tax=Xenotaenia resolanae TaxID=208358 RepID=A0ABV0WF16_9TELE